MTSTQMVRKAAIVGLSFVVAFGFAAPAFAAPKNLPPKAKGVPFTLSPGQFTPPGQLKKLAEDEKKAADRAEHEQDKLVKAQDKAFKDATHTAQDAFNKAMKAAQEAYKQDKKAARDTLVAAIKAAGGDQNAINAAITAYTQALMTALQKMLAAKQAAIGAFIAALQNLHSGNQAPTANAQSVSLNEDGSLAITLTGSDPENSALAFAIVAGPSHGVLSGTGATRTYAPNANFNGSDSFTFKVNDGALDSAAATVSISVAAVNDPPVANNQNATTSLNVALALTLAGSDVDGCTGQTFTYAVTTQPANGAVSPASGSATCSGGTINATTTYTPTTGFSGGNSFAFKLNDGTADSATGTVSLTVTP